jgi:hypothetical protein
MEMNGVCSMHGEDEKYRILAAKHEGKRLLGKTRHR